jgi:hypothetical protein
LLSLERQGGTVTITRVGTNQKYADGWEAAFAGKRSGSKSPQKKGTPSKKAAAKKATKKGKK